MSESEHTSSYLRAFTWAQGLHCKEIPVLELFSGFQVDEHPLNWKKRQKLGLFAVWGINGSGTDSKSFWVPLTFTVLFVQTMEVSGTRNRLVLQNIFFCVPQKKRKRHEGEFLCERSLYNEFLEGLISELEGGFTEERNSFLQPRMQVTSGRFLVGVVSLVLVGLGCFTRCGEEQKKK